MRPPCTVLLKDLTLRFVITAVMECIYGILIMRPAGGRQDTTSGVRAGYHTILSTHLALSKATPRAEAGGVIFTPPPKFANLFALCGEARI